MYEQGLITLFHNLLSKFSGSQPLISPSRQPGKYARRHSCPGKFHLPVRIPSDALWDGFNIAVATEQHANAGEGQVYLFIFFLQILMLTVSQYIVSVVAVVGGHR